MNELRFVSEQGVLMQDTTIIAALQQKLNFTIYGAKALVTVII